MPIITIHLLEGRDKATKEKMMSGVTESICRDLKVPPESVRIILREMKEEDFGIGGIPVSQFRKTTK